MPTTADTPYFHQPSVEPISTAMRGMPAGNTADLYATLWRSKVVVLGMETTRTAIFLSANSAWAFSANYTSEPVAMITACGFLFKPTSLGSANT